MINLDELKTLFKYNPETGVFIWLVDKKKSHILKAGRIAGGLNVDGYLQINYKGTVMKAHRLAWLFMSGEWPKGQIDHINHKRDDNRFINLRVVNNLINHKNRPIQSNNTSGFVGVSFYKRVNKWTAHIYFNKKHIFLGYFDNKEDAIFCRKEANIKYGYHENHGFGVGIKRNIKNPRKA